MSFGTVQSSFISGELDPRLRFRIDIQQYYNGGERIRNLLVQPQGGSKRRPGLEYIDKLKNQLTREASPTISVPNGDAGSSGGATANDDDEDTDLQTTTGISTTNPYVVVHYDLGSAKTILFADIVGFYTNHSADVTGEFFIQYSTDNIAWTSLGAAIDANKEAVRKRSRRRTGPISARYWRFARIGSTDMTTAVATIAEFTLWVESASLSGYRLVRFQFSTTQKYILLFTDRNMRVFLDGVYQIDARSPYEDTELGDLNWVQALDTLISVHSDVPPSKLLRQGDHDEWQYDTVTFESVPKHDFTPTEVKPATTLTPSATSGVVTLTAGAAAFVAGDVDQIVDGNGGRARIISFTSTTVVKAVTIFPFFDTTAIPSGGWKIERGYEDAWSASRGYPAAVTIHDQRLVLAGGSRPSTYWMSRVGQLFNFSLGQNLDDDGLDITAQTDSDVPEIYNLVSGDDLEIYTSTAEFINRTDADDVTTPQAAGAKLQSGKGSRQGIRPVRVDSASMFIQREGRALREFLYDDIAGRYKAQNISLLASHLLVSPQRMAYRMSTADDESDLVFITNNDGTLAVLSTLRDQDITAWSLQTTNGSFLDVAVDLTVPYFITERTINSETVRYLERFNTSLHMDAGTYTQVSTPITGLSGLGHLEGETVQLVLDGAPQNDVTVTGGTVTFERAATSSVEIGLGYSWLIRTMPLAESLSDGTKIGDLKRVVKATVEMYETYDVLVNGNRIFEKKFGPAGSSPLDAPPTAFTGRKMIEGLQGYDLEGQIEISGELPLDATILGVELKVAI